MNNIRTGKFKLWDSDQWTSVGRGRAKADALASTFFRTKGARMTWSCSFAHTFHTCNLTLVVSAVCSLPVTSTKKIFFREKSKENYWNKNRTSEVIEWRCLSAKSSRSPRPAETHQLQELQVMHRRQSRIPNSSAGSMIALRSASKSTKPKSPPQKESLAALAIRHLATRACWRYTCWDMAVVRALFWGFRAKSSENSLSGRLPYTCECCHIRFRWQVSLKLHKKRCQAAHQKKRRIVKPKVKPSPAKVVESPSANIFESPPEPQPPTPAVVQLEVSSEDQQQLEVQRQPKPVYKCEKKNCDQIFNSSISLARHSRIHPSKSSCLVRMKLFMKIVSVSEAKPESCVFCLRPCAQVHWTRRCCTTAMVTRSGRSNSWHFDLEVIYIFDAFRKAPQMQHLHEVDGQATSSQLVGIIRENHDKTQEITIEWTVSWTFVLKLYLN